MQSMTGYGRMVVQDEVYSIVAEVAAVNRKNLEIAFSGPREWYNLERVAVELARKRFARGRLQLQVKVERLGSKNSGQLWDDAFIIDKVEAFRKLCENVGIPCNLNEELLVNLMRLSGSESQLPEWEVYETKVTQAIEGAFDELMRMRNLEGVALAQDLVERLQLLKDIVSRIETIAPEVGPAYRKAFKDRLAQAELDINIDDERVLKEIALFVDRSDISEEITRLKSHFDQLGDTLKLDEAIGRKIDFILQEIFREFNTIGSKANHIEISQSVIQAKNELERLREQAQNIE
jgi:uncharacterized protein (TIGR00255 family)